MGDPEIVAYPLSISDKFKLNKDCLILERYCSSHTALIRNPEMRNKGFFPQFNGFLRIHFYRNTEILTSKRK